MALKCTDSDSYISRKKIDLFKTELPFRKALVLFILKQLVKPIFSCCLK